MAGATTSPIEDLNAAIQNHNPFDKPAIVTNQNIWDKGFPDVASLNAHASNAVFQTIEQVRTGQCQKTSIAVTAEPGVGKSHIISRIRHRLQAEGGTLFVYARRYGDLKLIKYQFQQILADSLRQIGSQEVMQWQELATAMFNQAAKTQYSPKEIVEKFPFALVKDKNLMNKLTAAVLKTKPNISDPDIIRAILWTLSESHAPYAIKWLSGKDLAQLKADELSLPNPREEDQEAEAFEAVRQILDLVSDYNAPIICFDEIEGAACVDPDEDDSPIAGFVKEQVIASLVKDLFDNLSRGIILTVMMPATWRDKIKQLPGASGIPDRVSAKGDPIDLRHIDGDSIVELTTLWLGEFYKEKNLVPSYSLYPFKENQLKGLGKQKPTVRQVLKWCKENFIVPDLPPPPPSPPKDPVEPAFRKELEEDLGEYLDDIALLDDALFFGFSVLVGQTIEGVMLEEILDVEPKKENGGYINFKIIAKENEKPVKIGVSILQQSNNKGVAAGLKRLVQYKKLGLTRGCLVRSRKINSSTLARKHLDKLLSDLGGEWVLLKAEDIKPLIAILSVYSAREDYELSEDQIFDFVDQTRLVAENSLIREILSDPSGQIPDSAVDEDTLINMPNIAEIPDSANMPELTSITY